MFYILSLGNFVLLLQVFSSCGDLIRGTIYFDVKKFSSSRGDVLGFSQIIPLSFGIFGKKFLSNFAIRLSEVIVFGFGLTLIYPLAL